jgi:soluble lytic murein transglycosylase-like protein
MPVPRWAAYLCALLLAVLAGPVSAESLYRCTGISGETVFTGHTDGYKDCKKLAGSPVNTISMPRAAKPAARPVVPTVDASVTTTAKALPPPSPAAPAPVPGKWAYQENPGDSVAVAPAASKVLRGAVYRIVKADGGVEYTNVRPAGDKGHAVTMLFSYIATCAACDLRSPINWDTVPLNLTAYADVIRSASAESGVDEALLRAIIHAESAFNPRALSIKGAQGLMQLMPGTGRDMGVMDAFDANQNIRGGARYLALLLKSFNGDERLAAAAYNAGQGAVQRYNGVPPYAETQVYVERVGQLRKRYGTSLRGAPLASRSP